MVCNGVSIACCMVYYSATSFNHRIGGCSHGERGPLAARGVKGLEVYEKLKGDIQWAVGLKNYVDHLSSNIADTFVEMNLGEREKAILWNLTRAQGSLDKATVVIRVMKEQSNALVLVLNPSAVGTDHEKLWAAVRYFSRFVKDMKEELERIEDALQHANDILENSQLKLSSILERVQVKILDKKTAKAKRCQIVYGGATIVGTIMLIFIGDIGPLLSTGFTAGFAVGITEGYLIEETEEGFWYQLEAITQYIEGFERISAEIKALQERLVDKRQQLINIHTNLNTTGTLVGIQIESLPLQHFEFIQNNARALLEACETFFDRSKTKMLDWVSN